jgi:hypothetical protein
VETGEALAVLVSDEPGMLDRALRVISDQRINLDYVYTCAESKPGKIITILGVQSPGKVEKLLKSQGIEIYNE